MYDPATIQEQFEKMMQQPKVYKLLGIPPAYVRKMRLKTKNGLYIRMETKIKYLQRYGLRMENYQYSLTDLVEVINYYNKASSSAKMMGVPYVVNKFILRKKNGSGKKLR